MQLAALVDRIDRLVKAKPDRILIGIAGAPGAGKTTLAHRLVAALLRHEADWTDPQPSWAGSHVAHVPMDGFHLADVELDRLGRRDRKGAPDTFDAAGYQVLLARLRTATETVWAPGFDRDLEQPIAGSIPVGPAARVVITEGNYLLLAEPAWSGVRGLLDEVWFCDPARTLRLSRLIARHEQFGKAPAQARAWALGTDERNAALVQASKHRADLLLSGDVQP